MTESILEAVAGAALSTGRVAGTLAKGAFRVETGDGKKRRALLSAGCLLEPGAGDLVLLVKSEQDGFFIVQVLERSGGPDREATLRLPEASRLRAGGGTGTLSFEAEEVNFRGGVFRQVFKKIALAAETLEAKAELLREVYNRRHEDVATVKDSRVGRLRCLVGGLFSLRGETVDIKAEKRVKIDGKNIDVG